MSKEFSEDKLIQASAAELLKKELSWRVVFAPPRTETISYLN